MAFHHHHVMDLDVMGHRYRDLLRHVIQQEDRRRHCRLVHPDRVGKINGLL